MKKYFIVIIVVLAFLATTMPVCADSVFNDMSKCIKCWGKECKACAPCAAAPAKEAAKKACCCKKTDVLGNKIDKCTNNSGKTLLGT